MPSCRPLCVLAAVACIAAPATSFSGDLAVLSEKTWDGFVPKGKEVDAIYGDFVLRNDKIIVVIANPIAGRNANMTVKDVRGAIIDLTLRHEPNDQLSAYYPGTRRFPYELVSIGAEGNVDVDVPGSTQRDSVVFQAVEGKLTAQANVVSGATVQLKLIAQAAADRPEVHLTYTLRNESEAIEVRSEFRNTTSKPMPVALVDDFRADRTFVTAKAGPAPLVWFFDKGWGQAYGVISLNAAMRLTGSPIEPRTIEFLHDGKPTVEIGPGAKLELVRWIAPGRDLVNVKASMARQAEEKASLVRSEER